MSACKTLWELCSHGDSLGSALGMVEGGEGEGEEVGSLCFTLTDPTQKRETYFLGRREREEERQLRLVPSVITQYLISTFCASETKAATSAAPAAPTSRMLKMERIAFFQTE